MLLRRATTLLRKGNNAAKKCNTPAKKGNNTAKKCSNAAKKGIYFHDAPAHMPQLKTIRDSAARALDMDPSSVTPIGFHGGSVPHQKKGTIEVISWNPCGYPEYERTLFCMLDKSFLCKCGCKGRHSIDAALSVFCWSMGCLARGQYPTARHDGSVWASGDSSRKSVLGPLPRALLL